MATFESALVWRLFSLKVLTQDVLIIFRLIKHTSSILKSSYVLRAASLPSLIKVSVIEKVGGRFDTFTTLSPKSHLFK